MSLLKRLPTTLQGTQNSTKIFSIKWPLAKNLKPIVNTAAATFAADEQVLHQTATLASMHISCSDAVRTHTVDQASKNLGSTSSVIDSTTDKASKLIVSQVFASDQMTAT